MITKNPLQDEKIVDRQKNPFEDCRYAIFSTGSVSQDPVEFAPEPIPENLEVHKKSEQELTAILPALYSLTE